MTTANIFGTVMLWSGALVGTFKLVDWLLSDNSKKRLATWSMRAWIWLDDQRLGKFISTVRDTQTQTVLSVFAHLLIIAFLVLVLGRVYFGWSADFGLMIGMPHLYEWQIWVDVAAMIISMLILSASVHPRIAAWIGSAQSLARYFARTLAAWAVLVLAISLYLNLATWIIEGIKIDFGEGSPYTYESAVEAALGGRSVVIAIHVFIALLGAPIWAELLLLQFILFFSLAWLIAIWLAMAVHAALKLFALRVAEHKDGPILGFSALLVAIGAITKAFSP